MFDKVINGVREDGHHVLRAISAESCLNGELDTAGSLLLPALVESLPLETTCLCFPASPVSTWNVEASTGNVNNLFSLCTLFRRSFGCITANPHLYTILPPQSWSTMKPPFLLFLLIEQKQGDVIARMRE